MVGSAALKCQGTLRFSWPSPHGHKMDVTLQILHPKTTIFKTGRKVRLPHCLASKRKFLINLTKEVKDLYSENYTTLMKEIEDNKRNGKISHALGLEELILLKWPYYPKQSTDLMQSLSKYP